MYPFICRLLEERLKAMLTSLPLVSDLHHPAMRERHWKQLMKVGYKLLRCACTCLMLLCMSSMQFQSCKPSSYTHYEAASLCNIVVPIPLRLYGIACPAGQGAMGYIGYALLRCACTCNVQHASCCCVCCPCNLKAASLLLTHILRQLVSVTLRFLFLCVFMG